MAVTPLTRRSLGAPFPAWSIILVALVGSYFGIYFLAPRLPSQLSYIVIQPVMYLLPGGIALWMLRHDRRTLWPADRSMISLAAALGVSQISLLVMSGVWFGGFGNSPYSHTPQMLGINLWYVAAMLVGREVSRWFLVQALRQRGETFALVATWIIFVLTDFSPFSLMKLAAPDTLFEFMGLIALPIIGRELLATRLALVGGPVVAGSYVGLLMLFEWMSPILPTPYWLVAACVGILVPLVGLSVIDNLQTGSGEAQDDSEAVTKKESWSISPAWVVTAVAALLIFWFNTGILGIYPTLVHGISMEPMMYTGDVSVIRRVPVADLKVGDVIQIQLRGRFVIHRIIRIEMKDGRRTITTQGDNVASPDESVDERAVMGRMLFFVPKIGWPIVKIKTLIASR